MDSRNINALIHHAAGIIVVASDEAALKGLDDLAQTLYNIACSLYDESYMMDSE